MTIKVLSPETHVNIAVVDTAGNITGWQYQPFFTLADLYPDMVTWMLNRTSLSRPDAEETVRNHRVFTGIIYLKLSEEDEQQIKDGNTGLIDTPLTVTFPNGHQASYILNSLWSSATKSKTLTGYIPRLNRALRKIFNYAESGVRVGRATRGGFSNGKVVDWPVQFLPMNEMLNLGGIEKPMGDGETIIRESDAVILRRTLVADPFMLGQWRLSAQITSQVKHPDDQESIVLELLPHVAQGLERINDHSEFIAHAFRFGMKEESRDKLVELARTMEDHPDLNLALSPDKARTIFDVITTGKPKSIQGFVAIAGSVEQSAVFPSKQTRFPKSELYDLVRYPVNNSRCIMPVVAIQEGPQADFLNEIEQFQGTLFGSDGTGQFMAAGQFIVVPDRYWPAEYAEAKLIVCSKNIKADSTWKSAADVKATQGNTRLVNYTGYISVCQWAHKGNGVMVDPEVWKEANGDFDFDEGEAIPESEFPMLYDAFLKEWMTTEGLAVSKLPKIYTFDEPEVPRTKTLVDTLAGAMAVGMAANCNLIILNSDPRKWPEIAREIGSDAYFYGQMVAKGYIIEEYPQEQIDWFMEICECSDEEARRVIRMFYVLSFFIQCGVDGFKTNLDDIGGMTGLVDEISRVWKVLTEELSLSQRIIQFNPKKSLTALRDKAHLPEYGEGEEVFGISETLMKMAVEGFSWEGWPYRLDLPEYLYLGNLSDSFKFWAIGPRTMPELEAARLLRRVCRDELARRSMMAPQDWVLFAEKFWRPLLQDFHDNARVILRYDRKVVSGKVVYNVAKARKFPALQACPEQGRRGISWKRIAHLLWFVFHDNDGKSTGSAIPLFWVPEMLEYLLDLIEHRPGQINYQDDFEIAVVGLNHAGVEYGVEYPVEVRVDRINKTMQVDPASRTAGRCREALAVEQSRNVIQFDNGRYVMVSKDGPLLAAGRYSVTFKHDGSRDIGHFVRSVPVGVPDSAALSARLRALRQEFAF